MAVRRRPRQGHESQLAQRSQHRVYRSIIWSTKITLDLSINFSFVNSLIYRTFDHQKCYPKTLLVVWKWKKPCIHPSCRLRYEIGIVRCFSKTPLRRSTMVDRVFVKRYSVENVVKLKLEAITFHIHYSYSYRSERAKMNKHPAISATGMAGSSRILSGIFLSRNERQFAYCVIRLKSLEGFHRDLKIENIQLPNPNKQNDDDRVTKKARIERGSRADQTLGL